jgi:LPS sulfotransferase NodH
MAKYDSYVICTSPRSGGTLLCKLLAAVGVARRSKRSLVQSLSARALAVTVIYWLSVWNVLT